MVGGMTNHFEAASLTVRLGAITANYKTFRQLAGPAAVAGVVKADGYGLGAALVAPALAGAGCDTFFVARLQEGLALRPLLPKARILVLDGAHPDAIPALIAHRLVPVLNSLTDIAAWSAAARQGRSLEAAIHIDSGMNRLGLSGAELTELAGSWRKRLVGLDLVLLMSHLACADTPKAKMNQEQLSRFRAALAMLPPAPASLASSGGVLLGKDYLFDLVRPGIGLYGGHPQPAAGENPMQPAAVLTGRILQLRRIDKAESVGYAATFHAKRPSMLATVALGYADGLRRALSNHGMAAFAGSRVPIVGRVSMDLVSVDVSAIPATEIGIGDEVEFLGDTVRLDDVADAAGTNAYEILTGLSRRLPRHYLSGPISDEMA
jgi:alanine racemase